MVENQQLFNVFLMGIERESCFKVSCINFFRAERIWCMFVLWTIRAPNIFLRGPKYCSRKSLCSNHSVKKLVEDQILNLILTGWKVVGYSKKEQIKKRRLCHRCFPMNFEKFLRTPFLESTSGQLLLDYIRLHFPEE